VLLKQTQAGVFPASGMASQTTARSWIDRLNTLLPFWFALIAAPLIVFFAVNTPPFQIPDEANHFLRAYQIAHGGFAGTGSWVDAAIPQLITMYDDLEIGSHPEAHLTAATESAAQRIPWAGKKVYADFGDIAVVPPVGYIPQAVGVFVGERAGLSVFQTLRLSRLLNGAFALASCVWALVLCRRGRFVLFTVLLMPTSLSLFASCSRDATVIVAAAIGCALVSCQLAERRAANVQTTVLLAVCFFTVAVLRPPYVALLMILLIPGLLPTFGRKSSWPVAIALTGVLTIATVALTSALTIGSSYLSTDASHDPLNQVQYLFHHPAALPIIFWHTVGRDLDPMNFADAVIYSFVGILDRQNSFPLPYYMLAGIALVFAIAADLASPEDWTWRATTFIMAAVLVALVGVYLAMYLSESSTGEDVVEGVVGRYWTPLVIAVGIGLPRLARLDRYRQLAASLVVLFPLLTAYYVPVVVFKRFYL
jgi:uncharacterized membrane protein